MKELKLYNKDGKLQTISDVVEFAFGKNYIFVYKEDYCFSLQMENVKMVTLNDKEVKIPKRCPGGNGKWE